jgi:hypothetical protein
MTTSTSPTDDIIELTEIVEEGLPLDKRFEDFAMDKAVDAKSLDQELDDLLRENEPQPASTQKIEDEIDLDILFEEPAPAPAQPQAAKAPAAEAGMDMSDIDDLFDSLGIGEKEDGDTALDIILDGDIPSQPQEKNVETFYPSDSIDLELDIPGTGVTEDGSSIHELTDELLADIPETILLHSPQEEAKEAPQQPVQDEPAHEPEELPQEPDVNLALEPEPLVADEAKPQTTPEEAPDKTEATEIIDLLEDLAHPVATGAKEEPQQTPVSLESAEQPAIHVPAQPMAAMEILSARLDALESRPAPSFTAEELLALLPQLPQDVPATQALRQEILDHVESRISELASSSRLDSVQESVNALQGQVEALPDLEEELAKRLPDPSILKLETDLEELRGQLQDKPELQPEQILALLPQSPHEWPVAQALRQEIIDFVESRISELASSSSMDGLQESVNALQSQVEAIPDIRSELAKAPSAAAMQKIEAQLGELSTLVHSQDQTITLLRQTLADKDAAIGTLSAEAKALREELAAQASAAPAASDALKDELRQYVQQQVPIAAAKIIREEIKALLKELGG